MKQILSNDIINQYMPTLVKCPLFNTLGEPELRGYLNNAKVIIHSYKKNDFIALAGDPMEGIGVILEPDCHQCQTKILSNLLEDLSEKAILLTRKVHYLTLKGMREKIFAYLTDIYKRQHSNTIQLPHNREQMAEVLNVSRTALSRELGRLRDEGLIDITGRTVTIKNIEDIEEFGFNTF